MFIYKLKNKIFYSFLFNKIFIYFMSTETDEILEKLKKLSLLEAYELVKQIL